MHTHPAPLKPHPLIHSLPLSTRLGMTSRPHKVKGISSAIIITYILILLSLLEIYIVEIDTSDLPVILGNKANFKCIK